MDASSNLDPYKQDLSVRFTLGAGLIKQYFDDPDLHEELIKKVFPDVDIKELKNFCDKPIDSVRFHKLLSLFTPGLNLPPVDRSDNCDIENNDLLIPLSITRHFSDSIFPSFNPPVYVFSEKMKELKKLEKGSIFYFHNQMYHQQLGDAVGPKEDEEIWTLFFKVVFSNNFAYGGTDYILKEPIFDDVVLYVQYISLLYSLLDPLLLKLYGRKSERYYPSNLNIAVFKISEIRTSIQSRVVKFHKNIAKMDPTIFISELLPLFDEIVGILYGGVKNVLYSLVRSLYGMYHFVNIKENKGLIESAYDWMTSDGKKFSHLEQI